jgi:hypothetical protein
MLKSQQTSIRYALLLTALVAAFAMSAVSLRPAGAQTAAGIAITKVVDWNGVTPYPVSFEICIESVADTFCDAVGPNEVALFEDIPEGTYTVSEEGAGPRWTTVISQNPIVVDDASPIVNATVTNTHVDGEIVVNKVVNWNDVTPYDVDFQVCVTSTGYGECDTVSPGGDVTFEGLPPGTYTITEPGAGSLWSTQISTNPVVIANDQPPVGVTVTNTHVAGGTLVVTKQVNWNFTNPDPAKLFNICITGNHFADCENVTAGNSIIWTDLPPGTYVITESNPGTGWGQYSVTPSQNVTVTSNQVSTRTVTNTRIGGGRLDITKTVNWAGQTPIPGTSFQVCISSALHSECREIDPGETISIGGLPAGLYTISEVNPGSGWATPVITPNAVWVANGETSTATVANTRGGTGRLEVQKIVRWNGVTPTAKEFEICIFGASLSDCKTIVGAGVLTWTNLPAGPYSISETNPGAGWATPSISESPVTVVNGQTTEVTVINDRIPVTVTPTATPTSTPTATAQPQTPTATSTPPPATATATRTADAPGPPSTGSGLQPSNTVGVGLALGVVLLSGAAVLASRGRWRVEG